MPALVLIQINCDKYKDTCFRCDYKREGECLLFDTSLIYSSEFGDFYRCEECVDSE